MDNPIGTSLLITAIGMGLVFVAILFLWALMELTVRLTAEKESPEEETDAAIDAVAADRSGLKARAAAAAVAIVMSIQGRSAALRASRPLQGVSAWQSAMRSTRLSQRNNSYFRKPRGIRS